MPSNRLASETSPYLLQHAHNPVDWYPWGPEALERARAEDRPVLLSIGYSACHWCHVMERESFEDADIAALMNESFVNVKVDREERPDVDAIYMRAVQALTGRGGWPLTVFLTPSGEPYYGGTYFPPEPRPGMPSFPQVLRAARSAWDRRRDEVESAASEIRSLLERAQRPGATPGAGEDDAEEPALDARLTDRAFRSLASTFDDEWGGFGRAPKFPQPVTLDFLLRHHRATGNAEALRMVVTTLRRMAEGGVRDHLGGGFHRYSVDARWLVPHFEKMLYDNALLARLYVQAWQVTGDDDLRRAAEETLDWLLDDMRAEGGAFFAARDADSEGEEGLYYVWTPEEVEAVLGGERADLFMRVYDVTEEGNFEGRSILHLRNPIAAVADREGMEEEALRARLDEDRRALLAARGKREPPLRDGKVLAAWNGMAIRAFAEAGGALGRDDYVEAARSALDWLLDVLRPREGRGGEGRGARDDGPGLLHVWTAGEAKIPAFLEDWAALGNAALTLHEVTLEPRWLDEARRLARGMGARFWEETDGVFYDTPEDAEPLVVRPREIMDSATPAGSSLAAELCLRLGHLLDDGELRDRARGVLESGAGAMARYPSSVGRLLSLVQGMLEPALELVVIGDPDDPRTRALLREVLERYIPGRTVTGAAPGAGRAPPTADDGRGETPTHVGDEGASVVDRPGTEIPLLRGRRALEDDDGRPVPTAYLCRDYACERPVTEPDALREMLDR